MCDNITICETVDGIVPELPKCCFFYRLRYGCILIVLLTWVYCVVIWLRIYNYFEVCESGPSTDFIRSALKLLYYLLIGATAFLVLAGLAFLVIGIILFDCHVTSRIFLWALTIFFLIYVIYSLIIMINRDLMVKQCVFTIDDLVFFAVFVIAWIYFFIIVKSYGYLKMDG